MCRLYPYKSEDASAVLSWINDERTMRMWGTDKFSSFPIAEAELNAFYFSKGEKFSPFSFYDGKDFVGHMTVSFENDISARFAHVVVDSSKRGKGYGTKMLSAALSFAFDQMHFCEVTIGVYEKNTGAYHCYTNLGFDPMPINDDVYYTFFGEEWRFIQLKMTAEDYFARKGM